MAPSAGERTWHNLVELYKRFESDEVPQARVRVRFAGVDETVTADMEGYFRIDLSLATPLERSGWHEAELELVDPLPRSGAAVRAAAPILVPPPTARFGVISDIDDTVMWTNVTDKLRMVLLLVRSNAHTRKPFKGVAAFYRALRDGASGAENNPVFYVSGSPWNLYTPLVEFLRLQRIPDGPLLLKDFGDHTLFASGDQQLHKLSHIERIFARYPELPFVLIGDSGEKDPEIYSEVVRRHPDRVRVLYIRSIDPDPDRVAAIDRLIAEVREAGAQLVLAPDTEFAAAHAAAEGLIGTQALADVRADKREELDGPPA
ncbi:App1 family protein [Aromatoleum buckelii]|uniref:DUF2183 domain-containing protein n=1 Tax=Aromatoleum buckelii TaxID=200254 RepID=A0ABX1N6Z2_9RHOO|nr:phosphatase domain-containing protein [Aromatoleum buckelii]MCK0511301.1 DUF2183 domain-containing protein [Aromatoleum buckelii]